ncbi:response regulator [Leptospira ognonensis]|uniref:histidine kinase n=1 Tax=Leptospira ognonensis TaxID=2484945 RepID=A0A4R9JUA2_9LEPT|nr:histidine kinase dimerization/phosphoacceptor domain -containing protein [Leptospira ognonensis]TGL56393.1 response regulator [Leptospira ognonensis]
MILTDQKTILLVEDNAVIALQEKRELEKFGYAVKHVLNGETAIETILNNTFHFDLILMDIDLGSGIDGTEAAEIILKIKDIPVVFLSSHTDPELVEKTEKITSYGYVVKNSGPVVLDASIKMAFKLYEAKRELLKSKEKAEESQSYINALLLSIDDTIVARNDKNEIEFFNDSFRDITLKLFHREAHKGLNTLELLPLENKKYWQNVLQNILKGEKHSEEFEWKYSDTHVRYYEIFLFPVSLGNKIIGSLEITRDITSRKIAEFELIAAKEKAEVNESRLIEAQTATKVGSWQTDLSNLKVIWSEETYHIFELNSQTFQASHQAFLDFVHPEDRVQVDEAFKNSFSTEDYNYIDHRVITSSGKIKHVEERWRIVKDMENKPILAVGTCQDISERKQAEEQIKRQLSEKRTLLKEVHHRIKNNIASIESLLSLQAQTIENEEAKKILQESITRIQSTRILYEKLLINKDFVEISIKNYVDSLIDSLVSVFPESKNIEIHKNIDDFNLNSKKVLPIGIIINELVTNIFKYAFEANFQGKISIDLKRLENLAILIIRDNGVGLDERTKANQSPGFGLTLVKMLAEQLNGSYVIENDLGTKNVLKFPI